MLTRHHTRPVTETTADTADVWAEPAPLRGEEAAEARGAVGAVGAGEADSIPVSGPVFVDSSGRRARRVRRIGWIVGGVCAVYTVGLVLSLTGATPIAPRTLLPLPGMPSTAPGEGEAEARAVDVPSEPSAGPTAAAGSGRTDYVRTGTRSRGVAAPPGATGRAVAPVTASATAPGTARPTGTEQGGPQAGTPTPGSGAGGSGRPSESAPGSASPTAGPTASASPGPATGEPTPSGAGSGTPRQRNGSR